MHIAHDGRRAVYLNNDTCVEEGTTEMGGAYVTIDNGADWSDAHPRINRLTALHGEPTLEDILPDGRIHIEWLGRA